MLAKVANMGSASASIPRVGSSPNRPSLWIIASSIQWITDTTSTKTHASFQSFLKMCQTMSPAFRLCSAVACRARQCRKDGSQHHGLRVDAAHTFDSRTNPLTQTVFVEPRVDKRQHAPDGPHF